jgi:hypothetical protein
MESNDMALYWYNFPRKDNNLVTSYTFHKYAVYVNM